MGPLLDSQVSQDYPSGFVDEEYDHNATADQQHFLGKELESTKDVRITRVYFQNLNGLKWDRDGGMWPLICQAMSAIHADIIGFVETNQDTTQYVVYHTLDKVAAKYFDHKKLIHSTSTRQARRKYKPGGTLMMTVMHTVSAITSTTRDRMGRWVSTQYQGSAKHRLTIIIAYQVCHGPPSGKNTAINQHIQMLIAEAVEQGISSRKTPRQAFIQDLTDFVAQRQSEGDSILLIGDFNETIESHDSGIGSLALHCGLVDLCGNKLGSVIFPSTYKRGKRRLDFALCTPDILTSVRNVGYDPYDYRGISSDHRGLYIDIHLEDILGGQCRQLEPIHQRDFTANNPTAVVKYVNKKYAELFHHNILDRLTALENLSEADHDLAERIDRDMVRASIIAAKAAKQRYNNPWSPALGTAWAKIHMYRMIRSQLKNPHINNWSSILSWQASHAGLCKEFPQTILEVEKKLQEAHLELRLVRQKADQRRQEYLEEKAMLYADLDQHKKARIVQQIKRAENLHRCYRKLRYIRHHTDSLGLCDIQIPINPLTDPKECDPHPDHWQTIHVPEQITAHLITRNRHHFGQAHGTPLTNPEFLAQVKYDGSGMTADLILEGQFTPTNLDDTTALFIKHMTQRTSQELTSIITKDEFLGKLKTWPEATTTSPSGLHLGHYHALWKTPNIHRDPEAHRLFEKKRAFLIRVHLALLNYAVKFAYPLQRWQTIVNVMIKKDPSNSRIHRLRVIHLYEADYNLLLSVKWRQAIHHAEDNHLLNAGLYGSRPGRSAHKPAFIELMQHEIYKSSMKSGLNKDLDATSCYDRILTWIANICSRRVGLHKQVAIVNSRTLEGAKYHLKTTLGVSAQSYQHCEAYPIYGTGQGSGNSPHLWCFVASVLFDAFQERAHGATFHSYDGTRSLTLFMVGFVDDCSQRVNAFRAHPQPSAAQLVELMKHDAQL